MQDSAKLSGGGGTLLGNPSTLVDLPSIKVALSTCLVNTLRKK